MGWSTIAALGRLLTFGLWEAVFYRAEPTNCEVGASFSRPETSPPVLPQPPLPPRHERSRREAANAATHHRKCGTEKLRHYARFQFAELRATHEKHHVHAGHAAAQLVRRLELSDDVADDGAHGVRCADARQTEEREPEARRQTKDDGRRAVSDD